MIGDVMKDYCMMDLNLLGTVHTTISTKLGSGTKLETFCRHTPIPDFAQYFLATFIFNIPNLSLY